MDVSEMPLLWDEMLEISGDTEHSAPWLQVVDAVEDRSDMGGSIHLPSLPSEVWDYIIDWVASDSNLLPAVRSSTLSACCRVCRSWLIRSRYNLSSSVTIRSQRALESYANYRRAFPILAARLEHLTVDVADIDGDQLWVSSVPLIFPSPTWLKSLHLEGVDLTQQTPAFIVSSCFTTQALSLRNISCHSWRDLTRLACITGPVELTLFLFPSSFPAQRVFRTTSPLETLDARQMKFSGERLEQVRIVADWTHLYKTADLWNVKHATGLKTFSVRCNSHGFRYTMFSHTHKLALHGLSNVSRYHVPEIEFSLPSIEFRMTLSYVPDPAKYHLVLTWDIANTTATYIAVLLSTLLTPDTPTSIPIHSVLLCCTVDHTFTHFLAPRLWEGIDERLDGSDGLVGVNVRLSVSGRDAGVKGEGDGDGFEGKARELLPRCSEKGLLVV